MDRDAVSDRSASSEDAPVGRSVDQIRVVDGLPVDARNFSELGITSPVPLSGVGSPRQVRKSDFMNRLRDTARKVSSSYRRSKRPVIGRPVLLGDASTSAQAAARANTDTVSSIPQHRGAPSSPSSWNPLSLLSGTNILSARSDLLASPTSSSGGRSVPQRRADFAPPNSPSSAAALAHLAAAHTRATKKVSRHQQSFSVQSFDSFASNSSSKMHASEAIVQTASRARSVRSVHSASVVSSPISAHIPEMPRLKPFTHASRVPSPDVPVDVTPSQSDGKPASSVSSGGRRRKRAVSQIASVVQERYSTADDLTEGMKYVRALGEDRSDEYVRCFFHHSGDAVTDSTSSRSGLSMVESFSSPEVSYNGDASFRSSRRSSRRSREYNVLLQIAQSFAFRIPLKRDTDISSANLTVRQLNGEELPPAFLVDWGSAGAAGTKKGGDGKKDRPTVKIWGIPEAEDAGEWDIGVFEVDTGKCLGSVVVRVVESANR